MRFVSTSSTTANQSLAERSEIHPPCGASPASALESGMGATAGVAAFFLRADFLCSVPLTASTGAAPRGSNAFGSLRCLAIGIPLWLG